MDSRIALIRGEETCPWQDVKASHPYAGALLQAQRAAELTRERVGVLEEYLETL